MKKFTGNYSSDAGKALKSAGGRIFCKVDEDGMIYTCTGYFVYRMRPDEYAATVQPVTKCDAGNWIIENGEKREAGPADFDVIKTFRDTVNACTGAALDRCPADFTADLRSRRLTVRGDRGEWSDNLLLYLDEQNRPQRECLRQTLPPQYRSLDTPELRELRRDWHPELRMENAQDEYAIATMLLDMGAYLKGGQEPYPLREALDDACFWLLAQRAVAAPWTPIESCGTPWNKPAVS